MMNKVVYMNSYDDAIVNYKGNDLAELVGMFSEDDIDEMRRFTESVDYDYTYTDEENIKCQVVCDYIKELLIENIRYDTITGTRELFRLVMEVM